MNQQPIEKAKIDNHFKSNQKLLVFGVAPPWLTLTGILKLFF